MLVCCFLKTCLHLNELISFDYLHSNESNTLRLLPERPFFFSFHTMFIFYFHIKVIPLKFNEDESLELLSQEFY